MASDETLGRAERVKPRRTRRDSDIHSPRKAWPRMLARAGVLIAIVTVTAAAWEVYRRAEPIYANAMASNEARTLPAKRPMRFDPQVVVPESPAIELTPDLVAAIGHDHHANPAACAIKHFGRRYAFGADVFRFEIGRQVTMTGPGFMSVTFRSETEVAKLTRSTPNHLEGVLTGLSTWPAYGSGHVFDIENATVTPQSPPR